ncbi:MAG: hypothetical protein WAQ47_04315 [Methanosarcina flavescens]|jgi:Na+/H+ antiporter NhaD/arsenite permease-like protein
MALAAGSTIAGNLLILGTVSNVIIQNAEKERKTISFAEFSRIGILITILDTIIHFIFL